jgi:CO/xanthine dehydrogenase Mo-binding subunit
LERRIPRHVRACAASLVRGGGKAHARQGTVAAMAHGFNRWSWSEATFGIDRAPWTADIDALAVRRGGEEYARLDRSDVKFPRTDFNRIGTAYTSLCGTAVRIEIERATGALRIAQAYSVLECGEVLVPEIVLGQAQGGFAMGVGYALLESLPLYEDGPGNGKWNLGQYLVARGSDLPLHSLEIEILPPVDANERPKGIAEVVMIPVVPALLNAIFDATGRRFQSLPVTQAMLKDAVLTAAPK